MILEAADTNARLAEPESDRHYRSIGAQLKLSAILKVRHCA